MTDKYTAKRRRILDKYGKPGWAWYWSADGRLTVYSTKTGKIKDLGFVDDEPRETHVATPTINTGA